MKKIMILSFPIFLLFVSISVAQPPCPSTVPDFSGQGWQGSGCYPAMVDSCWVQICYCYRIVTDTFGRPIFYDYVVTSVTEGEACSVDYVTLLQDAGSKLISDNPRNFGNSPYPPCDEVTALYRVSKAQCWSWHYIYFDLGIGFGTVYVPLFEP